MTRAVLVWGTQLSLGSSALTEAPDAPVLLLESEQLCRRRRYHQQKIFLVLAAMRGFAEDLRVAGREVVHVALEDAAPSYWEELGDQCARLGVTEIVAMQTADRAPTQQLDRWCADRDLALTLTPDTLFLTSREQFATWAGGHKRLQLEQFYRWQRARLDVLMEGSDPVGGRWNFDADNRSPLPKDYVVPPRTWPAPTEIEQAVRALVVDRFADHPGSLEEHWLSTTRAGALAQLDGFVRDHLPVFGDYEDAMRPGEPFVHHSVLSPYLNLGLLHPQEVLDAVLEAYAGGHAPLASVEGFVRQVLGWREFVHGLYHLKGPDWKTANALDNHEALPGWLWELGEGPELPLTGVLATLRTYGWNHHIERLMVLGSWLLLHDSDPAEVLEWFTCMYVDAYEWVMVPNVIGMSQYADGGADAGGFATKPYLSGSAYLQRMGGWWPTTKAAKASAWTEDYWAFLERHHAQLRGNHRLAPILKRFDRPGAPGRSRV